jgi:hypothetical protein
MDSPFTMAQFLDNARRALTRPTLYWLGHGGWMSNRPPQTWPGNPINTAAELEAKEGSTDAHERDVARQYRAALNALGLTFAQLPQEACDCSAFVAWALGLPKGPAGGVAAPTIWTGFMVHEARSSSSTALFRVLPRALEGCLLVYSASANVRVGHVGIVSQVGDDGRAQAVIHCSPQNFLINPAPGAQRSAIAETAATIFHEQANTMMVTYTRFKA